MNNWFGKITTRFPVVPLREVAKLGTGHTPSRSIDEYWVDCTIPWVTVEDIRRHGQFNLQPLQETTQHISKLGLDNSAAVLHPAGTVMLSRTASIGFSCIVGKDMATTQAFVTWAANRAVLEPRFLHAALKVLHEQFDYLAYGATHLTIYFPDIKTLKIPLPPLQEQRAIADFLDSETLKIDDLIKKQEKLVNLLEIKIQSILYEALTKGMSQPKGFIESNIPWVGKVPSHWVCGKVKNYYQVTLGKMLQNEAKKDSDRLVKYLRAANIQTGGVDISDVKEMWLSTSELKDLKIESGDVLVCEGGDVGRCSMWKGELEDCYFQNSVNRVRPIGSTSNAYFYYWMLYAKNSGYIDILCNKSTIAHLTAEKLSSLPMVFPPLQEQEEISKYLDDIFVKLDDLIMGLNKSVTLLKEHRATLISAAVTGKIDLRALA